MDKSALGWEHVEKVEKHESQKGMTRHLDAPITYLNVNIFLFHRLFIIHYCCYSLQIINPGSEEVLGYKMIGKINLLWVGNI